MMEALPDIKKSKHRIEAMIRYTNDTGFPVNVPLQQAPMDDVSLVPKVNCSSQLDSGQPLH
jgi:hypothetical protein